MHRGVTVSVSICGFMNSIVKIFDSVLCVVYFVIFVKQFYGPTVLPSSEVWEYKIAKTMADIWKILISAKTLTDAVIYFAIVHFIKKTLEISQKMGVDLNKVATQFYL